MRHILGLIFIFGAILIGLSGCTPADQQYCNRLSVAGTAEYTNCMHYYHTQEQAFTADRAVCDVDADETYPRTLYDQGRYQPVFQGGFSPYGHHYGGGGVSSIYIEPDHYRNAQVDQLRLRIIEPCMQARGWNSPASWQAGRHTVSKKTRSRPEPVLRGGSLNQLPWMN